MKVSLKEKLDSPPTYWEFVTRGGRAKKKDDQSKHGKAKELARGKNPGK